MNFHPWKLKQGKLPKNSGEQKDGGNKSNSVPMITEKLAWK